MPTKNPSESTKLRAENAKLHQLTDEAIADAQYWKAEARKAQESSKERSSAAYNGWTNRETWLISLWIDNEQSDSEYWQERCQEALDDTSVADELDVRRLNAASQIADELSGWFDERADEVLGKHAGSSFWADLLGGALARVNWHEVATNWMADIDPS